MKRHCLYTALLWCVWFVAEPSAAEPVPDKLSRPNILLLVADDLGLGDLHSFNPATVEQTPTIDSLAAQGMRFDRFYTDSTCSASRAALLTGQHPARLGFHPVARGVDPDVITLPEWLQQQGYSTHHIGKWHVGELNVEARPHAQGFDTSFGFLNQWFLQGPDADGKPLLRQPVYQNPWLEDEQGSWRQYSGYLPDILTQRATEDIAALASAAQPWFIWYATPLPHGPLHAPPEAGDAKSDDEKYTAMIRHLDRNVGELLSALDRSGQRDNTIIIFLSDNGAPGKRIGSNAGFSGGKAHYSEGAVRTAMIWVDKSHVMPNSLDQRAITIEDVFPTLAARIGAPLPFATDGIDINQLSNIPLINQRSLNWMTRGSASVLSSDKRWRTVEEWTFREKKSFQFLRINSNSVDDQTGWRYWYIRLIQRMQQPFEVWLEEVSRTVVNAEAQQHGSKVSGNDFLRTPLKEWDFYVALTPDAASTAGQVIAEQAGVWSMAYQAQQKQLVITMYGHRWQVPVNMPTSCTLIGLNADVYDRYTNMGETVNPTELLLTMNGKEVARTDWQIDSLADVIIHEPTWMGRSAMGEAVWQGKLSRPVFYHRANVVGEWPYFIDELTLQQELCRQL